MGSGILGVISGAPKVSEDFNVDLTPLAGLALQRLMSYAGGRRVLEGPADLIIHMVDGAEIPRPTTWYVQNRVNNGISTTNLNWWSLDFWAISIIEVFRYGIFTYTFGFIFIFDNVVLYRKHG